MSTLGWQGLKDRGHRSAFRAVFHKGLVLFAKGDSPVWADPDDHGQRATGVPWASGFAGVNAAAWVGHRGSSIGFVFAAT